MASKSDTAHEMKSPLLGSDWKDSKDLEGKITIKVSKPGRKQLVLVTSPRITVARLKETIEAEWKDCPKLRQRIIYRGRELSSSKILSSEPNPIVNGDTVHLALRPENRVRRISVGAERGASLNQQDAQNADDVPMAIELATQEIIFVQMTLNRSSRCIKAIGLAFVGLGAMFVIRGGTIASWMMSSTGGFLMVLGALAIHAGRNEGTFAAGLYYYSLWFFMVFLGIMLTVPFVTATDENNQTTYMLLLVLMVRSNLKNF